MTLLLLHSAGSTPAVWDRVRVHLRGITVIAPALPGRDGAGPPETTVAAHGEAVLRVMDEAGIERATVAGHSLGGAVALWLALQHPSRVAGLGIVNSGARMRVAPAVLEALPARLPEILEAVAASNFAAGVSQSWIDERRDAYESVGGETLLADLTACDRFDVLDRLWEIRCRTQILAGGEDALTPPRHARIMAERVSAARFIEYPGAGHMLPIERAAEIAGELAVLWAASLDGAAATRVREAARWGSLDFPPPEG